MFTWHRRIVKLTLTVTITDKSPEKKREKCLLAPQ